MMIMLLFINIAIVLLIVLIVAFVMWFGITNIIMDVKEPVVSKEETESKFGVDI